MSSSRVHCTRTGAPTSGQIRRLDGVVAFRFPPEAAAKQRRVDRDVGRVHAEEGGDQRGRRTGFAGAQTSHLPAANWRARPAAPLLRARHASRNIRARSFCRAGEGGIGVALVAHRRAGIGDAGAQLLLIVGGIVGPVRAGLPFDLQRIAALQRRPGALGDHRHAAERIEHAAEPAPGICSTPRRPQLFRRRIIDGFHRAADHRRPRHDRVFHAGKANIGAIHGLAGGDVVQIVDLHPALADVTELLLVLEAQRLARGRRQRHGVGRARHSRGCFPASGA